MVLQVVNSPFTEQQIQLLNELVPNLSAEQKTWLAGYLAATTQHGQTNQPAVIVEEVQAPIKTITASILYGSQTGNAKNLATQFAEELKQNDVQVEVYSMADFPVKKLKKVDNLLIVTSTQGEGEAPDNAKTFYEFLHGARAPKLENLQYSVLGLGDTSYDLFCQTAIDFDTQLHKLGGVALVPRVDCDLDFQEDASNWFTAVQQALLQQSGVGATIAQKKVSSTQEVTTYSRQNPYYAEVLEKINLNMTGSNKETYHVELSLEGSGISFTTGDSIGIYPKNNTARVQSLLEALAIDANDRVTIQQEELTIQEALTHRLEITVLTKPLLEKLGVSPLPEVAWREGRDLIDLVKSYDVKLDAQTLADTLRKLPPRLYSIASSYDANPDEVHITVGLVRYDIEERHYEGVTSGWIASELEIGDQIPIFIQENDHFRLPKDDEPIIMIGAGTGIAPFRAFIEQRDETGATGESWLFFGEQHFVTDFLYQVEWQRYLKEGTLTKMSVAFSRDQAEKIYVQHRIIEEAKTFYEWLEKGATIFICGDEKQMAKDVEAAILQVIQEQQNTTEHEARAYLERLTQEKRYLRDVY